MKSRIDFFCATIFSGCFALLFSTRPARSLANRYIANLKRLRKDSEQKTPRLKRLRQEILSWNSKSHTSPGRNDRRKYASTTTATAEAGSQRIRQREHQHRLTWRKHSPSIAKCKSDCDERQNANHIEDGRKLAGVTDHHCPVCLARTRSSSAIATE